MQYDPKQLSTRDIYAKMVHLITPRPIAWVSTLSPEQVPNLAPFSFFNGIGANPPTLMFAPVNRRDGSPKDTLRNVELTKEFVVNLVGFDQAEGMNQTSAEYDADTNEFAAVGIEPAPSTKVKPPRVAAAKAAFECELLQTIHLGQGPAGANLVIGRIVMIHVSPDALDANGELAPQRLDNIGRLGGNDFVRTTDRFSLARPQRP